MIISMMSVGTGGERERYDECVKDGLVVSQVLQRLFALALSINLYN